LKTLRLVPTTTRTLVGVLLFSALLLTACGGGTGESWVGLATSPSDMGSVYAAFNE